MFALHHFLIGLGLFLLALLQECLLDLVDYFSIEWLNVQEMVNIIFKGSHSACAKIQLDGTLAAADLNKIRASNHIFATSLVEL